MISSINILRSVLETIPSKPLVKIGYWKEVSSDLALMGLDKDNDGKKFPLIIVNINATYEAGSTLQIESFKNIKFYLIEESDQLTGTIERLSATFESTLFPLRDEMLKFMKRSGKFNMMQKNNLLQFERTEQLIPYINGESKDQNKLNEIVDCIEITFKELHIKQN